MTNLNPVSIPIRTQKLKEILQTIEKYSEIMDDYEKKIDFIATDIYKKEDELCNIILEDFGINIDDYNKYYFNPHDMVLVLE